MKNIGGINLKASLSNIFKILLILILEVKLIHNASFDFEYWKKDWRETLTQQKVIPDVIKKVPLNVIEACYVIYSVSFGNHISPFYIDEPPNEMKWNLNDDRDFFTVALVGPDAPVHFDPYDREWQHWLVVNVPGCDFKKGEVLTAYEAPTEEYGPGYHRYVFLVFQQPGRKKIFFNEKKIGRSENEAYLRANFSILNFAEKYNLGDPHAVNFFRTDLDHLFTESSLLA